jgi:hypothetical protein
MCEECGETGHSANKCPIRPCNACGLRSHKLQTSYLCNGKWGLKYCAAELEIDHLYILPVSAPGISAAATSSTNTPTSTPTKQLNTRLTEINFD